MPKKARELSAIEVARLNHPTPGQGQKARFAVGGVNGLYLSIAPSGARSWLFRYTYGRRRKSVGLGAYPDVPLKKARDRARSFADQVWDGRDPRETRTRHRPTFNEIVDMFAEDRLAEIRSDKHRKQYLASIQRHAVPHLGDVLVESIEVPDILRVLRPVWVSQTPTAKKLRHRLEAIMGWATAAGYRSGDNPARWKNNLDHLLPKPGALAQVVGHPAVPLDLASGWFAAVRDEGGMPARALEFLALTAARSGEVRGMTWHEVDVQAGVWTVPAERMKSAREHRVPLSGEAVQLLARLPRLEGSEYVFPSVRGGALSDMAVSACMKRINLARENAYVDRRSRRPAVPHGLRSTFRDWTAEVGFDRDMSELALAHNVGSEVERAYRRTDMLERRRQMMDAWARFLVGDLSANVVALGLGR